MPNAISTITGRPVPTFEEKVAPLQSLAGYIRANAMGRAPIGRWHGRQPGTEGLYAEPNYNWSLGEVSPLGKAAMKQVASGIRASTGGRVAANRLLGENLDKAKTPAEVMTVLNRQAEADLAKRNIMRGVRNLPDAVHRVVGKYNIEDLPTRVPVPGTSQTKTLFGAYHIPTNSIKFNQNLMKEGVGLHEGTHAVQLNVIKYPENPRMEILLNYRNMLQQNTMARVDRKLYPKGMSEAGKAKYDKLYYGKQLPWEVQANKMGELESQLGRVKPKERDLAYFKEYDAENKRIFGALKKTAPKTWEKVKKATEADMTYMYGKHWKDAMLGKMK